MRPHYHDSTISRPICEVKHGQVWLVLACGGPAGKSRCCIFFSRFFYRGFQSHSTNSRKKVSTDKVASTITNISLFLVTQINGLFFALFQRRLMRHLPTPWHVNLVYSISIWGALIVTGIVAMERWQLFYQRRLPGSKQNAAYQLY